MNKKIGVKIKIMSHLPPDLNKLKTCKVTTRVAQSVER